MKPFIDRSIAKIERPLTIVIGAPSDDTVAFDPYRQGIEISNVKHFLMSNIPFMSSKGIKTFSPTALVDHELDMNNLGQGMNLDGFKPFDDRYEIKDAALILTSNVVQSDEDPYFGRPAQDGEIDVFSDTGKRSLLPTLDIVKSRGARAEIMSFGGPYFINDKTKNWFIDAADRTFNVPIPGYSGNTVSISRFDDKIILNSFGMKIEYTYIAPDQKSPTAGYDYYGSQSGTDSVAYGGFLR